ncbi:cellulose synthase [Nonomuraea turkmeniaca]|uniref:Cellulose synthase n=1 Tax=Nonomuraea turkmeniaca TaxID=103838 RepID=A0A5S4FKE9_9ACTN|nr:cellulose synthase [Nonomuraea turkmeniaca]TMR09580.1 cellulose synthase [Nonomuraea turkmeniaca]
MDMFNQLASLWLPLCAGATIAGLVFSFLAFRRRGAASGMRVAAWALLPMAAYLTGALQMLWTIGTTVVGFITGLVLNPLVWAGVAVAGLSVVLFVVSGVLRGRKLSTGRKKSASDAPAQQPVKPSANKPAVAPKPQPAASAPKTGKGDDDFSDIEELLKRRGIS